MYLDIRQPAEKYANRPPAPTPRLAEKTVLKYTFN